MRAMSTTHLRPAAVTFEVDELAEGPKSLPEAERHLGVVLAGVVARLNREAKSVPAAS